MRSCHEHQVEAWSAGITGIVQRGEHWRSTFTKLIGISTVLLLASPLWSREDEKAEKVRPAPTAFEKAADELFAQRYPQKLEEYFCSLGTNPALGFRGAGTSAEIAAGRRIEQEMTAMGLSNVRREPVPVDVFEFKKASITLGAREMIASTFGGVSPTPAEGITSEIVYVKKGTAADFDAAGDVAGKLVLIDFWPKLFPTFIPAFEAELRKAAGIILTSVPEDPKYFSHNSESLGAFDSEYELSTPPMVFISQRDVEWLKSQITEGKPKVTMKLDVQVKLARDGGVGYNVLGEIPGSCQDGQSILMTAHQDAHFRGAVDNTSGVVGILTLAKAMRDSGFTPKHKITFMATCAEEYGRANTAFAWLTGSWGFISAHQEWSGKVRAVINIDSLAQNGSPLNLISSNELEPWLNELGKSQSRHLPFGVKNFTPQEAVSDGWPFTASGIPSVWFEAINKTFWQEFIHTQFDTPDKVDWDYFAHLTKVIYTAVQRVDEGLLPYHFEATTKHLANAVNEEKLLAIGAKPLAVSNLRDVISALESSARRFEAKRQMISADQIDSVNSELLGIAKVLHRGLTAISSTCHPICPHQEVLANALSIKAALEALKNPKPDTAAALKALEEIYPTGLGTQFSNAVYQRLLQRSHPDSDNLNWAALGKLPVPPDVMPEYRAIERGQISPAVSNLEAKRRALVVELNKRLEGMVSVLNEADALMKALL